MNVGTQRISDAQQRSLEQSKRRHGGDIIRALLNLVQDDDIRQGREDVHPDWLDLFETRKTVLQRQMPDELYERIRTFFEEIEPFEPSLRAINPANNSVTFLLGAGASKPAPSNIPTVKELLPQLLERARRLDRDDVTKLADYCDDRKIDNIEDLLTAAQLATFCSRSPTVLRLLNYLLYRKDVEEPTEEMYIEEPWGMMRRQRVRRPAEASADVSSVAFLQDTLQVLFGLLASTMLPARPNKAHEAIVQHACSRPGSAVITTNYDCCMDLALEEKKQAFGYRIGFSSDRPGTTNPDPGTRLIKLHGSLNWYYCETCQEVQRVDIASMVKQYAEDTSPYPVIGICKDCGGQRRGLLVPPLAMKFDVAPPLTPLLREAEQAFEAAELIVVVGFSFAEADIYISRMLSKSMQTKSDQKLLIVDPDSKIVARVRRKFKASIPNFDIARIIRASGDCSEMLPKFLAGEMCSSGAETRRGGGRPSKGKPNE